MISQSIKLDRKTLLFMLLLLLMQIAVISCKKNYHIDEVYTYGLANNTKPGVKITLQTAPYIYEPAGQAFKEYMTVSNGERFNFKNVWEKQTIDVHPPIYYVFIHILSSVFVGSGSRWIAGTVNIIFMLLTFGVMQKILSIYGCTDKEREMISIFFIFSPGMLDATAFFRMYIMTMFLVTLYTWLVLSYIDKRCTLKFYVSICINATIGALTHYYFILYLFFISLFYGLYLLINKKFIDAVKYIIAMLISGVGAYLIFPAMLTHIFGGYRGKQSFENMRVGMDMYWPQLKKFWQLVDKDIFGGLLLAAIGIVVFLFLSCKNHEETDRAPLNQKWTLIIPLGSCICYFLLVAKIAVFVTTRYMYPIYTIIIICVLVGQKKLLDLIFKQSDNRTMVLWVIGLGIMTFSGWKNASWGNLHLEAEELLREGASYQDVDCLYIYDSKASWKIHSSYMEINDYKSVTFFVDNVNALSKMPNYCMENEYIVYICDCDDEAVISQIMEYCPQINTYDKRQGYGGVVSYHLYGDNIASDGTK